MNSKGTVILVILIAVAYFMFGMLIMNLIKGDISNYTGTSGLNCTTPATDGDKVTCLIVDATIPIFIIAILSASG